MNKIKRRVYNFLSSDRWNDSAIFFLRLFVGVMMMIHGIQKIQGYNLLVSTFPDPIGLGRSLSLITMTTVEIVGSFCLITGILVRPVAIILAFGMFVATFLSFPNSTPLTHELPFIYMGIYIALAISGGGMYSLDKMLFRVKKEASAPRMRSAK